MKIKQIEKELKNELDDLIADSTLKFIASAKEEFKKEEQAAKLVIKDLKKAEKTKQEVDESIEELKELISSFKAQIKKYVSDRMEMESKKLREESKAENDQLVGAIMELQKTVGTIKTMTINNMRFVKKYNK